MGKRTFTAVLHKEEDGHYSATCPEAGTVSQGRTVEEALANLRQATELYFSVFPYKKQGEPVFMTFEVEVNEPEAGQ